MSNFVPEKTILYNSESKILNSIPLDSLISSNGIFLSMFWIRESFFEDFEPDVLRTISSDLTISNSLI